MFFQGEPTTLQAGDVIRFNKKDNLIWFTRDGESIKLSKDKDSKFFSYAIKDESFVNEFYRLLDIKSKALGCVLRPFLFI